MADTQLYIAIVLPTLTILASMTVSLFQISGVREDIREIRSDLKLIVGKIAEMDTRLSLIEEKMR